MWRELKLSFTAWLRTTVSICLIMPLLRGSVIKKGRILTHAVILVLLLLLRNQSVSLSVFKNLMLMEPWLTVNQHRTTVTHRWRVLVCQTVVELNSGDVRKPTFSTSQGETVGGNSTPCVFFLSAEHITRSQRFISASTSRRNQDLSGHVQLRFRLRVSTVDYF